MAGSHRTMQRRQPSEHLRPPLLLRQEIVLLGRRDRYWRHGHALRRHAAAPSRHHHPSAGSRPQSESYSLTVVRPPAMRRNPRVNHSHGVGTQLWLCCCAKPLQEGDLRAQTPGRRTHRRRGGRPWRDRLRILLVDDREDTLLCPGGRSDTARLSGGTRYRGRTGAESGFEGRRRADRHGCAHAPGQRSGGGPLSGSAGSDLPHSHHPGHRGCGWTMR